MRLVAADERRLSGPGDFPRLSIAELSLQVILDILAQMRIDKQPGWLGSLGHKFGFALRERRPIFEVAAASRSVAGQLS